MHTRSINWGMAVLVAAAMFSGMSADAQLATNLNRYSVVTMNVGTNYFSDRTFQITSMPAGLAGAEGIRTANDDKNQIDPAWLTFDVSQLVYVYVAYDNRGASNPPTWLQPFEDTGLSIAVTDGGASPHRLFRKPFGAGQVVLGGNRSGAVAGPSPDSNYFVLLTQAPVFTRQPESRAALEGTNITFTVELTLPVNPVTYQWQKDQVDISGETGQSLTLTGLTSADEGNYRCVVTDGSTKAVFISDEALLIVAGGIGTPVAGGLGIAGLIAVLGLGGAYVVRRRRRT